MDKSFLLGIVVLVIVVMAAMVSYALRNAKTTKQRPKLEEEDPYTVQRPPSDPGSF